MLRYANHCVEEDRTEMCLATRGRAIPEADLMLCCARTVITPEAGVRVKEIARSGVDWEAFLQLAGSHGVRPLVYQTLRRTCWDDVPEATRHELDQFYSTNSARNRFLAGELLQILRLLEAEHILAVPFKGPVLATLLYGNLELREFVDLDFLLREGDIPKARQILLKQGYEADVAAKAIVPDSNVVELHSGSTGIMVELHSQFSPRRFVPSLAAEDVWEGIEPIVLWERQIWSFSAQDMFLFLAVHGGKHSWSLLKWLCDLAEFIRSNPDMDWPRVLARAETMGALRTCRLAICLAAELLQAEAPTGLISETREDNQVKRLAQDVLERIEKPHSVGPIESQIFNLKLKERLRDKLRYVFLQSTQYSGEEERFLPLPSVLSFMYILVRPIWLVRRYGLSLLKRFALSRRDL